MTTDDIRSLTAAVAADPASLLFLDLAERLRARKLLLPARTVVERGLERYPALAQAHALRGRILCDAGEHAAAADAWRTALVHDPAHAEARKGLAYLAFRAGEVDAARADLEALARDLPGDAAVRVALATVERSTGGPPEPALLAEGTMLLNDAGLRLAGRLVREDGGPDTSEAVAAEMAGATQEAMRAVRLLGLGTWRDAAVEALAGGLHVVPVTETAALVAVRDRRTPPGRLALEADQAARTARQWLESQP